MLRLPGDGSLPAQVSFEDQGALTLLAARATAMPAGNGALGMATMPNGKQLHVFSS